MRRSKPGIFWGVTGAVLLVDAFTKIVAVDRLIPAYLPRPVWGDGLRLTLVYNPGAAFGLHFGSLSRWIFIALTFVALTILGRLYLETPLLHRTRTLAIALVTGGALGNLWDRVTLGYVIDFVQLHAAGHSWPAFNVADSAISIGVALLLWDSVRAKAPADGAAKEKA